MTEHSKPQEDFMIGASFNNAHRWLYIVTDAMRPDLHNILVSHLAHGLTLEDGRKILDQLGIPRTDPF